MKPELHHCTHCEYACQGKDCLDEHVKQRHSDIGRNGEHKCEWCEYSTDNKSLMTRHRRIHTQERSFSCDHCGKAFTRQNHLTVHRQTHSGLRPYVCDVCPKAFTISSYLVKHRRVHHDRPGEMIKQCEQCGATFNRENYTRHMKTHGVKTHGVKTHRCPVCPAQFVQRGNLTLHVRTHTGERPYGCSFCPARFSHQSARKRHVIALHTHDYRHRCRRCGKGFVESRICRRHEGKCTLTDVLLTHWSGEE